MASYVVEFRATPPHFFERKNMVAQALLIGEVSEVLEIMDPQEGGDRCVFKVVTETASRDGQGVKVFKQTYHKVIAEGKLGQICSQCLHRGTHVFIQGAITDTPYTDSTSMEKVIKCVVMKMLGKEILKSIERQQEEGTFDESSLTGNR